MSVPSSVPPFLRYQHTVLALAIAAKGLGNSARLYLCLLRKACDRGGPGCVQVDLDFWCRELGWKPSRHGEVSRLLAKLAKSNLIRLTAGRPDGKGAPRQRPLIEVVGFEAWAKPLPNQATVVDAEPAALPLLEQATVQSESGNGGVVQVGNGSVAQPGNGFHSAPKKLRSTDKNTSSSSRITTTTPAAAAPCQGTKDSKGHDEEEGLLKSGKNSKSYNAAAVEFKFSKGNGTKAKDTTPATPLPPTRREANPGFDVLELQVKAAGISMGKDDNALAWLRSFAKDAASHAVVDFLALIIEGRERAHAGKLTTPPLSFAVDAYRAGNLDFARDRARAEAKRLHAEYSDFGRATVSPSTAALARRDRA